MSSVLLRFVAREVETSRVLVLAIYRDTDVGPGHPMLACAADLARVAGTESVQLGGLSQDDLARFIQATTGSAPPSLVQSVHAQTGGNPFFATECVRLLLAAKSTRSADDDETAAVPRTVREVVGRRLAVLSPVAQALLRVAAVLGREFDLGDVRRVRDGALASRPALLAAVDEALGARLIERFGADGRYRFAHDLVRETLYDALPSAERALLHDRVGRALEAAHRDDLGPHLASLAHHFACAAVADDPSRAYRYAVRAGRRAADLLAYEEAAAHYQRALLLGSGAPPAGRRRTRGDELLDGAELLLALGESQWKSGNFGRARESFQRAAERARSSDDATLLARAALGFGGGFRGFEVNVVEPELVALLEEAVARLPAQPSVLRGRVMARLAVALYDVPRSLERRVDLSAQAVRIAQRTRDASALVAALYARHWAIWGPDTLDDRFAAAEALERLGTEIGDRECVLHAHRFLVFDSFERADLDGMDRHLARCRELAEELRQPYYRWYVAQIIAARTLLAGDVEGSERRLEEAVAVGARADSRNVELARRGLLFQIRREQGRAHEVESMLREVIDQLPAAASWRCALALVYAEGGRPADARRELDVLSADDFAGVPRNAFWLAALAMASLACAELGDDARARVLYRLLLPYRGRMADVTLGCGAVAAVDGLLGRLAPLCGERARVDEHFAEALRIERGVRAPLLVARTERSRDAALSGASLRVVRRVR